MEKNRALVTSPIGLLKGVGPKLEKLFQEKGIDTVEDLLYFLPIRYEDRRRIVKIAHVREGEKAVIAAKVISGRSLYFRSSRKKAYEAVVEDGTGRMAVKWFQFRPEYVRKVARRGKLLVLSGEVSRFGAVLQMVHPDITVLDDPGEIGQATGIVPLYSEIGGLRQGTIRRLISQAFEDFGSGIRSMVPRAIETTLGLPSLDESFRALHQTGGGPAGPCDPVPAAGEVRWDDLMAPFRHRLILEEYVLFQMTLLMRREEVRKEAGPRFDGRGPLRKRFQDSMSFELTPAQKRVAAELAQDMARGEPMNRLLQGDVGCGKTICALLAACAALDHGYQVAVMAPTEILAEQHYLTSHRFFEALDVPVALLRGGMGREREEILDALREGRVSVVIGTHALLEKDVVFRRLGLAIIDEQHRFGVIQRKHLRDKCPSSAMPCFSLCDAGTLNLEPCTRNMAPVFSPHVLVMTATPIPRTLAMVVYGDLDVSVIDEMPPGRQPVRTKVYPEAGRDTVYRMVEAEVKKGHQVFMVYPLVEESERMELADATKMAQRLREEVFPACRVGLLHGRMKAEEKEGVMRAFKEGEMDILVCTTVIEVGIDVPNATLMVVEHAERFGLSQLHQLRGRVGRGGAPGRCLLLASEKKTGLAIKRLSAMEETTDGFVVAERDMEIRGPGDMLGVRQAGIPRFRVGSIVRDGHIMSEARKAAEEAWPILTGEEKEMVRRMAEARWPAEPSLHDVA